MAIKKYAGATALSELITKFRSYICNTVESCAVQTDNKHFAGAGAVKELNNNLGMPIRVDSVSGKPQWKDVGADSWHFFNSFINSVGLTITCNVNTNLGNYVPQQIVTIKQGNQTLITDTCRGSYQTSGVAKWNNYNVTFDGVQHTISIYTTATYGTGDPSTRHNYVKIKVDGATPITLYTYTYSIAQYSYTDTYDDVYLSSDGTKTIMGIGSYNRNYS